MSPIGTSGERSPLYSNLGTLPGAETISSTSTTPMHFALGSPDGAQAERTPGQGAPVVRRP